MGVWKDVYMKERRNRMKRKKRNEKIINSDGIKDRI